MICEDSLDSMVERDDRVSRRAFGVVEVGSLAGMRRTMGESLCGGRSDHSGSLVVRIWWISSGCCLGVW